MNIRNPNHWTTREFPIPICFVQLILRLKGKTLPNVDTLTCQLSPYSVCSWSLTTLANPAFILKTRDLLTIKNKSFPTPESQVDKKLTRKESPEEYLTLGKIRSKKCNKRTGKLCGKIQTGANGVRTIVQPTPPVCSHHLYGKGHRCGPSSPQAPVCRFSHSVHTTWPRASPTHSVDHDSKWSLLQRTTKENAC